MMNLYNKFYAKVQKRMKDKEVYPPTDAFKRKHLSTLSGTVIELGAGAGSNFRYLPKDIQWVGIEPNAPVNKELKAEAEKYGISNLELHNAYAESMPVESNRFDTALATFVLCSVKNQGEVLEEIFRVLKPGGKFIFIEHVAAEQGTLLRFYQNLTSPLHQLWAKNCHINRETLKSIENAGFKKIEMEKENIKMWGIPFPHIRGLFFKPTQTA